MNKYIRTALAVTYVVFACLFIAWIGGIEPFTIEARRIALLAFVAAPFVGFMAWIIPSPKEPT